MYDGVCQGVMVCDDKTLCDSVCSVHDSVLVRKCVHDCLFFLCEGG